MVYHLREAIVDIIYVGKDDDTVRGGVAANVSFDTHGQFTFASCGDGTVDANDINDGASTIHTKEQDRRLASRNAGAAPPADDNTVTSTIATEKSLVTKGSGSDSSYELV